MNDKKRVTLTQYDVQCIIGALKTEAIKASYTKRADYAAKLAELVYRFEAANESFNTEM